MTSDPTAPTHGTTDDPGEEPNDDPVAGDGYRSYEVYQRERIGETTNLLTPRELISDEMLTDPYRLLTILREHYPCYRDWLGNRFWVTRYDDVTSIFTDDANYETRPRRWYTGLPGLGRDLWGETAIRQTHADRIDAAVDAVVEGLVAGLGDRSDLVRGLAARLPIALWMAVLDLPHTDLAVFSRLYWRIPGAASWDARTRGHGLAALDDLTRHLEPVVERRRATPGDDLVSVATQLELSGGPVTAADIVATLLEADHETLHGGLANMWFLLLTNPEQLEVVRSDRRQVKFAWLEALRHTPPVQSAERFTRHEVERFGRLLPHGALVHCSAAAANRDPRVFADPDRFDVERRDLCQREPRGQYRADGLPSGIAFALGPPSPHPAVPKDRPRSLYALTRDVAVRASAAVLDALPAIRLAPGAEPTLQSLRLGEMYTCWRLPIVS